MKVTLRNKKYTVNYLKTESSLCGETGFIRPAIDINSKLKGQTLLDTEIHEMLHVCFPDLVEDAINLTATDIARFLWRRGYRR